MYSRSSPSDPQMATIASVGTVLRCFQLCIRRIPTPMASANSTSVWIPNSSLMRLRVSLVLISTLPPGILSLDVSDEKLLVSMHSSCNCETFLLTMLLIIGYSFQHDEINVY